MTINSLQRAAGLRPRPGGGCTGPASTPAADGRSGLAGASSVLAGVADLFPHRFLQRAGPTI
jgi:hypothetical protein